MKMQKQIASVMFIETRFVNDKQLTGHLLATFKFEYLYLKKSLEHHQEEDICGDLNRFMPCCHQLLTDLVTEEFVRLYHGLRSYVSSVNNNPVCKGGEGGSCVFLLVLIEGYTVSNFTRTHPCGYLWVLV